MDNIQDLHVGAKSKLAPEAQARRLPRQKHGLSSVLKGRGTALTHRLDGRTKQMLAMSAYRADLLSSMGGADGLSQQELTIIDLIVRDKALLDVLDSYLITVGCFSKRRKSAFPIMTTRQQISDSLTRKLIAIGLARRAKPVRGLADLLAGNNPLPQKGEIT